MAGSGGSTKPPANDTSQPESWAQGHDDIRSKGHVMFSGNYEFFKNDAGDLYQAYRGAASDGTTGRRFARWVAPAHMADDYITRLKEFSYQPQLL